MDDSSFGCEGEPPLQHRREYKQQGSATGDKIANEDDDRPLLPSAATTVAPSANSSELQGSLEPLLDDIHTILPHKRPLPSSSEERHKQIRRSDRQIKRPKFDDELVESVTMQSGSGVRLTPRKRPSSDRPTAGQPLDEVEQQSIGRKKGSKGPMSTNGTAETTPLAAVAPNKTAEKGPSDEAVETQSLASDRKKREKIAGKLGRVAKHRAGASLTTPSSATGIVAESFKRWTAEDDVALTAAAVHTCDLKVVHSLMKFSKRFSLTEIEERWWMLLYDEDASRAAKKRMDALSREKVRSIQSKIPFSPEEECIVKTVPSTSQQSAQLSLFEQLLEQNRHGFHHARSAKVVEEHWRELKYYGLLNDQRAMTMDDELLQMESQLVSTALQGGAGGNLPLDVEERHLTRNLISVERDTQEWERVLVEAVTGSLLFGSAKSASSPATRQPPSFRNSPQPQDGTGHGVYTAWAFSDLRYQEGQGTDRTFDETTPSRWSFPINLALEGPSARVSRKQALLKLCDNDELYLHNVGNQPIFVGGKSILKGEKARLNNGDVVEISLIRLHLARNENYRRASGQPPAVQPPPPQSARSRGSPTKPQALPQPASQQSPYPFIRDISPQPMSAGCAPVGPGGSGVAARAAVTSPPTSATSTRAPPPFHHL